MTATVGPTLALPALEARGVQAGYGRSIVVRDLDLAVHAGEVLALIGPNGAGKTTTVMTLAGAQPRLGGRVLLGGDPAPGTLSKAARSGLALITEQRAALMGLTVAENFSVARVSHQKALEHFPELDQHMEQKVGTLSGGQQQMVAVARALGRDPSVLLADELSFGLAPMVVDRLLAAVRAAADRGVAVLLVEQHIPKVLQVADRVVVMRQGRIVRSEAAARLRDSASSLEEDYFGG